MQGSNESQANIDCTHEFPSTVDVKVLNLVPYMKCEVYQHLCKARKARDNSKPVTVDFHPFPYELAAAIFEPIFQTCVPKEKKQQIVDPVTYQKISSVCSLYSIPPYSLDYLLGAQWWKIIDVIPGSKIKDGTWEVVGDVSLIVNPHNEGRITLKCNARLFNIKGIQQ